MTKKNEVYKCALCGNIVEVLHVGAGELVCCGQAMALMTENTVDAAKEKHVPVITKLADGYKVTSVTVDPEKMTVAGKQDVLETVTSLSLDAVTIGDTNNASSFTVEESVKLPTGVKLIGDTDKVSVSVNIEQVVEKRFTIDSIETSNLGSGLKVSKIDASSVAIKVSGVTSELNELSTRNMKAVLDLNGKGEGTYSIPVTVEVPKGTVTEVSPKEISVTIVKSS